MPISVVCNLRECSGIKNEASKEGLTLERAPWGESDGGPLCTDGGGDSVHDLECETGAVCNAAAVLVRALVRYILQKLIH
jgi:hypothetical protein